MATETVHLEKSRITPLEIVDEIMALMHDEAREVVERNLTQVRGWVEARIATLGIDLEGDDNYCVDLSLKPYNRKNGLGIQSVEVEFSVNGQKLRTIDSSGRKEFSAPTIGVVAPGMVAGDQDTMQWAVAGFPVDEGREERIQILSDGFRFDDKDASEVKTGLPENQYFDGEDNVVVRGPRQARTLLQVKNPEPAAVRHETNQGVYACIYREARDIEKPLAPEDAIYVRMAA